MQNSEFKSIYRIVVVGRDAAFWLTMNTLRVWAAQTGGEVVGIELPSQLRPSDTYASLPQLRQLHARLGIDEEDLVRVTGGSYTLGQTLVNFSGPDTSFFQAYGDTGTSAQGEPFHLAWLRSKQAGLKAAYSDFSLNAEIAQQARFFGRADRQQRQPRRDYGFHFPAASYLSYLKAIAKQTGMSVVQARTLITEINKAGQVMRVRPDNGTPIAGDLFIDTTGNESLLLGEALKEPFSFWIRYFPSTQIVTLALGRLKTLAACSQSRAFGAGILHLTPVAGWTGAQVVFHKDLTNFEDAAHFGLTMTGLEQNGTVVGSEFEAGTRALLWKGNVVAIGESGAVFDPMANPGLYTIQAGLARLMEALGDPRNGAANRDAFNTGMRAEFENIRDYQIAHFKFNALFESGLWDYWRELEGPDTLEQKIETYRQSGQIHPTNVGPYSVSDWASLLAGHRVAPIRLSEAVGALKGDSLKSFVAYELNDVARQTGKLNFLDAELDALQGVSDQSIRLQG